MINDGVCGVLRFFGLQHDSQEACCDTDFSSHNHSLVVYMLYTCCLYINKMQKADLSENDMQNLLQYLVNTPQWLFMISSNVVREPRYRVDHEIWIKIECISPDHDSFPGDRYWLRKSQRC